MSKKRSNTVASQRTSSGEGGTQRRNALARIFIACHRFWNRNVLFMFLRVYLIVFLLYIALLSIYWGTYHNRNSRLTRLHFLAIIADDSPVDGIQPYIGNAFESIINTPQIRARGTWNIVNSSTFQDKLKPHNNNDYSQELLRQVYQENYWAGCLIAPNATYEYLQAIERSEPLVNSSELVHCIYETGRDLLTVNSYITPVLNAINQALIESAPRTIIEPLLRQVPSSNRQTVLQKTLLNNQTSTLITGPFMGSLTDIRPAGYAPFMGVVYTGLIYTLVISVQMFNFSSAVHAKLQDKLHKKSYILYRSAASQVLYLFLALAFALIVVAFQLPYDAAFGKSGFLVIWMAAYLNLAALGAINENFLVLIFTYDRSLIGFYIVGFMICNISPIMSNIALCPKFFRYGYSAPLYNYQKILIICLFDTTKRALGRHFAIIVAWIAVGNLVAPFTVEFSRRNAKKLQKMREA